MISQIGFGLQLNRTLRQWVDLGDLSNYTCMVLPENCGPDGGTLSAWIKVIECPPGSGFLGSVTDTEATGIRAYCSATKIQ